MMRTTRAMGSDDSGAQRSAYIMLSLALLVSQFTSYLCTELVERLSAGLQT